jgi:hypothetical protein
VGKKLGPRLLGEIGSDSSMFFHVFQPASLAMRGRNRPVSYQYGQIHKVYFRRHCNKFLRHTVHLCGPKLLQATAESRLGPTLAENPLENAGLNTPYNPDFHAKNQLEDGSWVFKFLNSEAGLTKSIT